MVLVLRYEHVKVTLNSHDDYNSFLRASDGGIITFWARESYVKQSRWSKQCFEKKLLWKYYVTSTWKLRWTVTMIKTVFWEQEMVEVLRYEHVEVTLNSHDS